LDDVDLLEAPIADVADEEPPVTTRLPRQPPRIAEPVGVDLGAPAAVGEWVVRRDPVGPLSCPAAGDVDAEDLAVELRAVLRVAPRRVPRARVARPAAIAGP